MICVAVGRLRGKPFFCALPFVLVSIAIWTSAAAHAQMLYSFENDLEGFFLPAEGLAIGQSTIGATDGGKSMSVEMDTGWTWDARVDPPFGEHVYNAFNGVAADLSAYSLDLDVTFTNDSWANVSEIGSWFQINLAVSSDNGWQQVGAVLERAAGLTDTLIVSLPMSQLPVPQNSSYYQLSIGSNSNFVNGPGGEGVTYFVDNIRFSCIPEYTEDLLYSWETPDDPGTPDVDERFEGWIDDGGHNHTITTTGATDGSHALQFDRAGVAGFIWGSEVEYTGGQQDTIDDLVERIESADRLAFDITLNDQFPASPTWLNFTVSISDNSGAWFQSPGVSVVPTVTEETTFTFNFGLDEFLSGGDSLADVGLAEGTDFLQISIATNTDDSELYGIYQIDNFRLLSEVVSLTADFNEDGKVDGDDFLIWQTGFGIASGAEPSDGDADADGDVDGDDFLLWQSNFGADGGAAAGAVPEPSAVTLASLAGWLALLMGRFRRRA